MNPITQTLQADKLIKMALEEDITSEDVSTNAVMPEYRKGKVQLLCKQDGVICGLSVFLRTFRLLDEATGAEFFVSDGDEVKRGQLLAELTGDIRVLLSGERVALNYLQRTPNMRIFEKYAVRVGGGNNHRYNLSDGVLLKDNHIGAAGGVAAAVRAAKEYAPFVRKIEIEVETLEQLKEALDAGADIVMLDNMSPENMAEAVKMAKGRAETECSGNVTKENISRLVNLGVDYISSGALTHSAPILDVSLKNLHPVD